MAGVDNLVSLADRTTEEKREIGTKGGKASGQARRRKKTMQEVALAMLSLPYDATKADVAEVADIANADKLNLTVQDLILLAQIRKAIEGDKASAEFIRDTSGQKPKEEIRQINENIPALAELNTDDLKKLISKE